MAKRIENNHIDAKSSKKYVVLKKKRHLKMILDDEVMLDQRKC